MAIAGARTSFSEDAAGSPGRYGGERAVLGRVFHPLAAEERGGRAGRGHAEGVDADDLFRVRVVDQRLCLAAPRQRVPHRAGGGDHGRRGVDGVAAALEDHRPRRRGERLSRHRHPVRTVQRRLLRFLREGGGGGEEEEGGKHSRFHARVSYILEDSREEER